MVHESPDHAWNDLYTAPKFDSVDGDTYLLIIPTPQQDKGTFRVSMELVNFLMSKVFIKEMINDKLKK